MTRNTPQTIAEAKKLSRNDGSIASSTRAIMGPIMMPAFRATRETLNASVRCSIVVTSAMIALLAVMNCGPAEGGLEGDERDDHGQIARQAEADVAASCCR